MKKERTLIRFCKDLFGKQKILKKLVNVNKVNLLLLYLGSVCLLETIWPGL